MSNRLQQQLTTLQQVLTTQPTPHSYDETYHLAAVALRRMLGRVRMLFYMAELPVDDDPLSLVPCPARQLNTYLFVHDTLMQPQAFSFATDHPYYLPIALATQPFGLLFFERTEQPLSEIEQQLAALLATQTAHHLGHLAQRIDSRERKLSPITINEACRQVWIKNNSLTLAPTELHVFKVLYQRRGHACSRDLICRTVYCGEAGIANRRENRLDLLIFKLRKKLSRIERNPISIETVRGLGYRLELA